MKLKSIGALCICWASLFIQSTTAEEEGFVFTEEEVAAYEEEERQMQAMLNDERSYRMACEQAYSDILLIVGNCYRGIGRNIELTECADQRTIAAIHQEAFSKLISKYGVNVETGEITKGAFSRDMLAKAKPMLTPQAYEHIESRITRIETMLKWFMGPFAKTCALFDQEYYEEVQMVSRFKELTQTSEYRRAEQDYALLWDFFNDGEAITLSYKEKQTYTGTGAAAQQKALAFFERYHNKLNMKEREDWYNTVILGAPDGIEYKYIRLQENGTSYAPTAQGAELSNYECRFDFWTKEKIEATVKLGKTANLLAMPAGGNELYDAYVICVENGAQDLYFNTYLYYRDKTLPQLSKMSEVLWSFEDFLKSETHYLDNLKKSNKYSIREWGNIIVRSVKDDLNDIYNNASKLIPSSHPSRKTD